MSSTLPLILRLPRIGHSKDGVDFVLVHVSTGGRDLLDLKLIGTESSAVFSISCKVAIASAAGCAPHTFIED